MTVTAPDLRGLGRSVELDAALVLSECSGDPVTSLLFVDHPDGTRLVVETTTRVRAIPGPPSD